jgi:hypothetical protein
VAALAQALDHRVDGAVLLQRALAGEAVHVDAEALQRRLDRCQHQRHAALGELVVVELDDAVDPRRDVGHVGALVAVLGRLLPRRPRPDRRGEALDLAAVVVDVVLAVHVAAGQLQDARERVAVGGVARGRDGDRTGRVGADELEVDALWLGDGRTPELVAVGERDRGGSLQPAVGHEQVEEAGSGDLDALGGVAELPLQRLAELLGDRPRRLLQAAREHHRRVGRVVAEIRLRRPLQRRRLRRRRTERLGGRENGGVEVLDGVGHWAGSLCAQ